jgi:hypothetical protein
VTAEPPTKGIIHGADTDKEDICFISDQRNGVCINVGGNASGNSSVDNQLRKT